MSEQRSERLYFINSKLRIQWNGTNPKPAELAQYEKRTGELPPYMPLPAGVTAFFLSSSTRYIEWQGKGPLPRAVLEYVNENGVLPRTSSHVESILSDVDEDDGDDTY